LPIIRIERTTPERQERFVAGWEPETAVARNIRQEKPSIAYPARESIVTIVPEISPSFAHAIRSPKNGGRPLSNMI